MQNTRLNTIFDVISVRVGQWLQNPWRRLSLYVISVLLGFFLGTAISTIAGQRANLDISVAAILILAVELVNRLVYSTNSRIANSLPTQLLNSLKIGMTYSLFVEAFKLGS
jgi:hypothetical protein